MIEPFKNMHIEVKSIKPKVCYKDEQLTSFPARNCNFFRLCGKFLANLGNHKN